MDFGVGRYDAIAVSAHRKGAVRWRVIIAFEIASRAA